MIKTKPNSRHLAKNGDLPQQSTAKSSKVASSGKVGRPPSGKIMVTLRLDPDVVAKFKATGQGWQQRVNDALKKVRL